MPCFPRGGLPNTGNYNEEETQPILFKQSGPSSIDNHSNPASFLMTVDSKGNAEFLKRYVNLVHSKPNCLQDKVMETHGRGCGMNPWIG